MHRLAVAELEVSLPEALRQGFTAIAPQLRTGAAVSDAELRVARRSWWAGGKGSSRACPEG